MVKNTVAPISSKYETNNEKRTDIPIKLSHYFRYPTRRHTSCVYAYNIASILTLPLPILCTINGLDCSMQTLFSTCYDSICVSFQLKEIKSLTIQ